MVSKLYVNGCSWTDGDTLSVNGLLDRLKIEGNGKDFSYPKLLSDYYQLSLTDDSRYGGSLNRIIRKTWRYIEQQENLGETIFIFEIPNGIRDEIFCVESNDYLNVTPSDLAITDEIRVKNFFWRKYKKDIISYYEKFWDFEEFEFKEWINFFSLIIYIKNFTNHVYLIHYDRLFVNKVPHLKIDKFLSEDNFIKLIHPKSKIQYKYIEELCVKEKISIGDTTGVHDSHPNLSGHKVIYQIIREHLNKMDGFLPKKLNHEGDYLY